MYPQLIKDDKVLNPLKRFLRYSIITLHSWWPNSLLSCANNSQPTAPVGQSAGKTKEIQRPPVEASGTHSSPAGRTPRWSCTVGQRQLQGGVCICVCVWENKALSQYHSIHPALAPCFLPSLYQLLQSSFSMVSVTSWTWSQLWHIAPTPPKGPAFSGCQAWATALPSSRLGQAHLAQAARGPLRKPQWKLD